MEQQRQVSLLRAHKAACEATQSGCGNHDIKPGDCRTSCQPMGSRPEHLQCCAVHGSLPCLQAQRSLPIQHSQLANLFGAL